MEAAMFDVLCMIRAMGDENRLRILMALRGKELCVCTLTGLLGLAPSTTSKHLSVLKQARLIESVKDGRFVYYRLTTEASPNHSIAGPALSWLIQALKSSRQVGADASRLAEIIEKGEQVGVDGSAATDDHKLYRHVPGIHAVGVF